MSDDGVPSYTDKICYEQQANYSRGLIIPREDFLRYKINSSRYDLVTIPRITKIRQELTRKICLLLVKICLLLVKRLIARKPFSSLQLAYEE